MFCLRPEWLFSQPLQIHLQLCLVSYVALNAVFKLLIFSYYLLVFRHFTCNAYYDQRSVQPRSKKILVKKDRATIDPDVLKNYNTVEVMHPFIEKYCNVYAKDLADRLSLNDRHLPDVLATPSLLNPLFGNKKKTVGSGLMSEGQYFKAWQNLFQKMQDILDKNNPLLCYTLSDNSGSDGSSSDNRGSGPFVPSIFFLFWCAALFLFGSGGNANTKTQTDAKQIESGFLPR